QNWNRRSSFRVKACPTAGLWTIAKWYLRAGRRSTLAGPRHSRQDAEQCWRVEDGERLALGQITERLVKAFRILDLCTRNCQIRIDLAAIAALVVGQIHQMDFQQGP